MSNREIPLELRKLAEEAIRNEEVDHWFNRENNCLSNRRPIDVLDDRNGRVRVEQLLSAIKFGFF